MKANIFQQEKGKILKGRTSYNPLEDTAREWEENHSGQEPEFYIFHLPHNK